MFTERKITQFAAKVSDLPDTPSLSAQELKARFDACPEQLRQALNGVCDDGKALEERIDAYRAQTFTGEVARDMLAQEVTDELDSKADDSANTAAHAAFTTQIAAKCEVVFGTYTGDGTASRTINLGFTPKAVLSMTRNGIMYLSGYHGGLALLGHPVCDAQGTNTALEIVTGGFRVAHTDGNYVPESNSSGIVYHYIAFR